MARTAFAAAATGTRGPRWAPTTRLGRVACWLALAFVVLWFANSALAAIVGTRVVAPEGALRVGLILFGIGVLSLGAVAGILGAVAIVRRRERAILVYLTLVPLAFVVLFLAGELLFPH